MDQSSRPDIAKSIPFPGIGAAIDAVIHAGERGRMTTNRPKCSNTEQASEQLMQESTRPAIGEG